MRPVVWPPNARLRREAMSKNETPEEKPTHSYEDQTMAVLEILQGAHIGGATVEYGGLLLHKDHRGDQSVRVTQQGGVEIKPPYGPETYTVTDADNEELIDAINVWAFKSIDELQRYLDDLDMYVGRGRHKSEEIVDADAEGNVVSIDEARAD